MNKEFKSTKGFTLAEILVTMAVFAILGGMIVSIFASTLRGSNKSQILANIKQNGQAVLDVMDKTIRGADNVVCYINDPSRPATLIVVRNGAYTRYQFVSPTISANGYIFQDSPPQPEPATKLALEALCINPPISPQILTDTNPKTGVSVGNAIFQLSAQPGSKQFVSVTLELAPGREAPQVIAGQIDPVIFKTTIELR